MKSSRRLAYLLELCEVNSDLVPKKDAVSLQLRVRIGDRLPLLVSYTRQIKFSFNHAVKAH